MPSNLLLAWGVGGKQVAQGKGEADDPLAKRDIGKHLIRQQGGGLGHATCSAAGAGSSFFAGKRHQPLEVASAAAYPEKAVLEAAALQVSLELPVDMVWQGFAPLGHLVHKGGVVFFDELVE